MTNHHRTSNESHERGILDHRPLPDPAFEALWDAVIVDDVLKERLLCQAVLNFTARAKLARAIAPMHGIIVLVGPPGTGKTSLARGLASRTADAVKGIGAFSYMEVEPHALASASLGKSQQAVRDLLGTTIAEQADSGPLIVVLDEVETLAADRTRMSLEANPIDVHRATDAVLAQLDQLSVHRPNLLFVATSNFPGAIDQAFLSRADLIVHVELPGAAGCEQIVANTVEGLARAFPRLRRLSKDPVLRTAGEAAVGLDGRRIRKAVLSALAGSRAIALDPERLTATDILHAVERAQSEARGLKEARA